MGVRTAKRHDGGKLLRSYRRRHGRSLIEQAKLWGMSNHMGLMRFEKGHPIPDRVAVQMVRDVCIALEHLRPELRDPNGGAFVYVRPEEMDPSITKARRFAPAGTHRG